MHFFRIVVYSTKGSEYMEEPFNFFLSEKEKRQFIEELTPELSLLRTKAGISQEELANLIGISRQTYGAIERKSRKMSWSTYLSLILFYDYNKKTHKLIRKLSAFPHTLIKRFNDGTEPPDLNLGLLFNGNAEDILSSLDEQALSTIKTVLMVEYSRCNKVSGETVIKMFEGLSLSPSKSSECDINTMKALKSLKRSRVKK